MAITVTRTITEHWPEPEFIRAGDRGNFSRVSILGPRRDIAWTYTGKWERRHLEDIPEPVRQAAEALWEQHGPSPFVPMEGFRVVAGPQ